MKELISSNISSSAAEVWAELDQVKCSGKYHFAWNQLLHHSWLTFAKLSSYITLRVTQLQDLHLSQIWTYSFLRKLCYFREDLLLTKQTNIKRYEGFFFLKIIHFTFVGVLSITSFFCSRWFLLFEFLFLLLFFLFFHFLYDSFLTLRECSFDVWMRGAFAVFQPRVIHKFCKINSILRVIR